MSISSTRLCSPLFIFASSHVKRTSIHHHHPWPWSRACYERACHSMLHYVSQAILICTFYWPCLYSCKGCNRCLNLSDEYLFPPNAYFDAGNKGTLSFSAVDKTDFRQKEDNSCFPFFETLDSWGLQRHRTKLTCAACGKRLGYIYYDGPYAEGGIGQYGLGHTQMIPRHPRYRLKREAMRISG